MITAGNDIMQKARSWELFNAGREAVRYALKHSDNVTPPVFMHAYELAAWSAGRDFGMMEFGGADNIVDSVHDAVTSFGDNVPETIADLHETICRVFEWTTSFFDAEEEDDTE